MKAGWDEGGAGWGDGEAGLEWVGWSEGGVGLLTVATVLFDCGG